jgi:KaiC/GvpD/RAD55 family RecA-like ATPase
MIQLAQVSFFTLAPMALGIITIFGRKGKKDEKEEDKAEKTPVSQQPATQQSPSLSTPGASPVPARENSSLNLESQSNEDLNLHPEETSLNKLLQSLLQEVPFSSSPNYDSTESSSGSTSDWVPPITTPSRPMVIAEQEKPEKSEKIRTHAQPEESELVAKPAPPTRQPEPEQKPSVQPQPVKPLPPPAAKTVRPEQEANKSSKPEKSEKQETKQPAAQPSKSPRGFEHLLDLTKGGLDSPGLVVVSGPPGSGKTSLSLNLAGAYLATGDDCVLVSYDQPVASIRDSIKNTGWDAGRYESAFHLLIFDAFSGQTDSMSFEPYYLEKPFDLDNLVEALARNTQFMMSSKVRIILDSITELTSRNSSKEFLAKFRGLSDKMRQLGTTIIVTVDEAKLPKETIAPLEEMAGCVIELQKDGQTGGQLQVKKLNGTISKSEPEDFKIQTGKGLLFT